MKKDFVIGGLCDVPRYYRTASEAFKTADYANPYSYFKPSPIVAIRRLAWGCVAVVFFLSVWGIYG